MVNYFLNTKQNEVKELGRIAVKMNRLMDESGESTVRKGESGTGSNRGEENGGKLVTNGWQKRNLQQKTKQGEEMRCLRL